MPMDTKAQLIRLILERSYREGSFTLASGKKSSFYIDLKATTLSARGARLIGDLAIERLREAGLLDRIQGVGGLTLGADPIATAISLASLNAGLGQEGVAAFIVRKEAKGHGTGRFIEGAENLPAGARVVVVEDVSTTGASAWTAVERMRDAGYDVAAVLTVVDRQQGATEMLGARGVPLMALLRLSDLQSPYPG